MTTTNEATAVDRLRGLAALGALIVGIVSLITALFPIFSFEFVAAGVLLIASGLSFGLLSLALSRG